MFENETNPRLIEILKQLNTNQLRYISIREECASDKEAAETIGISPGTVYNWPEKALIDEALNLMAFDGVLVASEILRRAYPKAAAVKAAGLDSDSEPIRQNVATEILDRGLGKPTQRTELANADDKPFKIETIEIVKDYGE